jgi:ubiquinone/menaquinone biosynthesis C-methylase UbiE
MVELAKKSAVHWNLDSEIQEGTNRSVPYPDQFFDIVLSIQTIHYEDNTTGLQEALKEFVRVGKPHCCYLIATVGNQHIFHEKAHRIAEHEYRLNTNEFRDGQIMAYFDDENHFKSFLKSYFQDVEVAIITESWPNEALQFYVAKCIK